MPERTDQVTPDEALRRAIGRPLGEPSLAAQVLIVTARVLELRSTKTLTPIALTSAMRTGAHAILATVPTAAAEDTQHLVLNCLPESAIGDTNGEFALRLRQAARAA